MSLELEAAGREQPSPVVLVETPAELARTIEACRTAPEVAVDVESNGLFAYRASLCVVQLAWRHGGDVQVAIVDPLMVEPGPLDAVLGKDGPDKLFHDLAFDVQLLRDHGLVVDRARDTAVAARLLGEPATGLGSLVERLLGVSLDKTLQSHDWAKRPLSADQLAYLADDVRYLFALADRLWARATELDVAEEIAVECAFRLAAALQQGPKAPSNGRQRPRYARVKGHDALDPTERAVLRRLYETRERISAELDCPPFRVAPDRWLVRIAREQPRSEGPLLGTTRRLGRASRYASQWLRAVRQGLADGPAPPAPAPEPSEPPGTHAQRKQMRQRIARWRRREAEARGIDVQAVLPGHCAKSLARVLAEGCGGPVEDLRRAIGGIEGLGDKRLRRYATAWLELCR